MVDANQFVVAGLVLVLPIGACGRQGGELA